MSTVLTNHSAIEVPRVWKSIAYILAYPVAILWLAGDWRWIEGWIFGLWFLGLSFSTTYYLYRKDPALLAERMKKPGTGHQKSWDRYFLRGIVLLFHAWVVAMPLDGKRFHASPIFPTALKILGAAALMVSWFFMYRAFTDNTYLSAMVRIQREREHRVVSTGVYAIVRHPMYLGAIAMVLGAPLLMGSVWGLLLGFIFSGVIAGRIIGEEGTLVAELAGYEDYRRRVKYRLLPGIW